MKKLLSMAIIASMALVSCSKEENPEKNDFTQDKEIKLNAGISASTKTAYSPGNAVTGVQFLRADIAATPDFSSSTPLPGDIATDDGNGATITFTSPQYYDKTADLNAWFVGYFPELTDGTASTWTIDGKTDIMTTADAVNTGKYSAPDANASMAFEHRLAQLFVKCEAANGVPVSVAQAAWGNVTKIEVVGVQNKATYTKGTAAITFGGTANIALLAADLEAPFVSASIVGYTVAVPTSDDVAGAMLAPSAAGKVTMKLKVYTAIKTEGVEVSAELSSFTASTKNTITLYFGAPDVEIGTKATIGAWETGGTGTGDVK